ncbi:hypothetical protein [Motiliproteus sediminis]|uniref:hypothetical protein n=1 Tax=Motiliproteus sediminis TaxID=1468178 RepID=UPI001AEF7C3B|nr:hypothetical protein [Motiliproteus sediminis]
MTPEEAFQKLDAAIRPQFPGITFSPSGICSRVLQVPFKDKSGLSYTLTLFVEVAMAPTTGVATGVVISHPPKHQWQSTPDEIANGGESLKALFDLIGELGKEYLTRERQTLKVLNNRDLGEQLARLCHTNGDKEVEATSDRFTLKKGTVQVKLQITENQSPSPLASVSLNVDGVDNKTLMSALRVLLQYNTA